ncbi:MAG: protease inhibitor I42 family protein [Candidatus Obscuribacterales bacterium]|nr:protease inhibitor I42 family protein [Candidatus Obscuribacterales bacterium]
MKKYIIAAFAFVFGLSTVFANSASAATVDLSKPVPKELEVVQGESIVFENNSAKISATDTDGKGEILQERPHNTFNEVGNLRAVRAGTGEITVSMSSQGLATVAPTYKIKVTVKAAPGSAAATGGDQTLNYNNIGGKQPVNDIELNVGDSLQVVQPFSGDPGTVEEPLNTPSLGGSTVLKQVTKQGPTFQKGQVLLWGWKAEAAGTVEIVFTNQISGKEVGRIKVNVSDPAVEVKAETKLNERNDGQTISVNKGVDLKISLAGNISTGYTWDVESTSGKAVEQVGGSDYVDSSNSDRQGAPGTFVHTFKANETGTTTINLKYSRPGGKPARTYSVTIDVK